MADDFSPSAACKKAEELVQEVKHLLHKQKEVWISYTHIKARWSWSSVYNNILWESDQGISKLVRQTDKQWALGSVTILPGPQRWRVIKETSNINLTLYTHALINLHPGTHTYEHVYVHTWKTHRYTYGAICLLCSNYFQKATFEEKIDYEAVFPLCSWDYVRTGFQAYRRNETLAGGN